MQTCTYSKSSSYVKLLSTRLAQFLSAKGTFCLYEEGMLISADIAILNIREDTHTWESHYINHYLGPAAL